MPQILASQYSVLLKLARDAAFRAAHPSNTKDKLCLEASTALNKIRYLERMGVQSLQFLRILIFQLKSSSWKRSMTETYLNYPNDQ